MPGRLCPPSCTQDLGTALVPISRKYFILVATLRSQKGCNIGTRNNSCSDMGQSFSKLFDLEKNFTFYAAYHDNPVNQAIHITCVPPILLTGLVFCAYTPDFVGTPAFLQGLSLGKYINFNLSALTAGLYAAYYALLDRKAGSVAGSLVLGGWILANYFKQANPNGILALPLRANRGHFFDTKDAYVTPPSKRGSMPCSFTWLVGSHNSCT